MAKKARPPLPLSLGAYGRHRKERGLVGGNTIQVSRAIGLGRLRESVVMVQGRPKIREAALADAEWEANTDLSKAPGSVKDGLVAGALELRRPSALAEASAREKNARANIAELEYRTKAGQLIPAAAVESAWIEMVTQMRAAMLAVPSKAKAFFPHLTHAELAQLNDLICQALEGLADKGTTARKGVA